MAITLTAEDKRQAKLYAQQNANLDEATKSFVDPNSPDYKGPGYYLATDKDGRTVARKTTDPLKLAEQASWEQQRVGTAVQAPTLPTPASAAVAAPAPNRSLNPYDENGFFSRDAVASAFAQTGGRTAGEQLATAGRGLSNPSTVVRDPAAGLWQSFDGIAAAAPQPPGAKAPDVDRSKIDPLLKGLQGYENQIAALAGDQTGLSVAEAQLLKSDQLASIRAAQELGRNQAGALGAARSARNAGDRVLLEQQAVGEQAYLGQEAQRQDVLRQAELEGNLSILRATEDDADRRFKLDALKAASDLGLNTSALELDLSKVNLDSANNWVNNEFQQLGINKQLDQSQTEALLQFTRDMAAIQLDYDRLSEQEQEFLVNSQLEKYGIDQQTATALKQIKESGKFRWDQLLTSFVGGAASGGGGAAAALALKSDERAKHRIAPVDETDSDFERLIAKTGAYKFEYRDKERDGDGLNFGVLAQELEDSPFGASLVFDDEDGQKSVDARKLAAAGFAGLGVLYRKVQKLQEELS